MSRLKSKQIADFNSNVNWTLASSSEIPNTRDIMNEFLPETSMVSETFVNQTISSSTGAWSLTLTYNVEDNNPELATLYINGLKTNSINSVLNNQITFDTIPYDIDTNDTLEVHYIKSHSV